MAKFGGTLIHAGGILNIQSWQSQVHTAATIGGDGMLRIYGGGTGAANELIYYGGTLKPGVNGVGSLYLNGRLDFRKEGARLCTLDVGFAAGGNADLAVLGPIENINNCDVVLALGAPSLSFDPTGGLTGTFMTGASITGGGFASLTVQALAPLNPAVSAATVKSWYDLDASDLVYDATSAAVDSTGAVWTAAGGDATLDGKVNVFDLAVLANNYNVPGDKDWTVADFDQDNVVGIFDLVALANNYGHGTGGSPVPEPASLAFVLLGLPALLRRRRK